MFPNIDWSPDAGAIWLLGYLLVVAAGILITDYFYGDKM